MYLAVDTTHLASSVCGAGAAGPGPPPSGPGAAPSAATSRDPSVLQGIGYSNIFRLEVVYRKNLKTEGG